MSTAAEENQTQESLVDRIKAALLEGIVLRGDASPDDVRRLVDLAFVERNTWESRGAIWGPSQGA